MKRVLVVLLASLLSISLCACNSNNTENSNQISHTTVSVETTVPETTVQDDYKISIPYACFDSVSKDDCIVTGTDMKNGILKKELSDNGGIILTVDKDKYDDLLEYAKNQFISEIERLKQYNADTFEKIEYSDNLDTIKLYCSHSYFYPETQPLNSNGGLPVVDAPATHKVITFGNIFKNSIYYQSLLKKTETELLTCKYSFIDSSDNSVVEEYVYPEK